MSLTSVPVARRTSTLGPGGDHCVTRVLDRRHGTVVVMVHFAGHGGGTLARRVATVMVERYAASDADVDEALLAAIRAGHRTAETAGGAAAFGSATMVAVVNREVWSAHVGAGGAWVVDGDQVVRLTPDHSVLGALVRDGHVQPEDVRTHPRRGALRHGLGMPEEGPFEGDALQLDPGDRIVVASPGLTADDEAIARRVRGPSAEAAADALFAMGRPEEDLTLVVLEQPGARSGRWPPIAAAVLGAVALVAVGWWALTPGEAPSTHSVEAPAPTAHATHTPEATAPVMAPDVPRAPRLVPLAPSLLAGATHANIAFEQACPTGLSSLHEFLRRVRGEQSTTPTSLANAVAALQRARRLPEDGRVSQKLLTSLGMPCASGDLSGAKKR